MARDGPREKMLKKNSWGLFGRPLRLLLLIDHGSWGLFRRPLRLSFVPFPEGLILRQGMHMRI